LPRDFTVRVTDILEAIEKIQRYTRDMSFDDFRSDEKTVDAVVRNVTTIGEAARYVPDEVAEKHPHVPWKEMRDIRNVVVHEYFGISLKILWETIQNDLPPLLDMLKKLVADEADH